MPTPIRTVTLAVAFLGLGLYWLLFLAQPLVEGQSEVNRAMFVMGSILYPEGYLISGWTDGGRLPLAILDRLPILAATLVWLGLATLIGLPLCQCVASSGSHNFDRRWSTRLVQLSLASLCGLALLSTLTLLVGLAGGLHHRWPLLVGVFVLLAVCNAFGPAIPFIQRLRPPTNQRDPVPDKDRYATKSEPAGDLDQRAATLFERVINNAVIVATVWLGAVIMLGAWVPPREFDVVEYHLQAPKEFYQSGRIGFVPHNIYANMPLGGEMHALAAMTILQSADTWYGGLIGKSITAAISIIGALLLGGWVAQRMGSSSGWSAAGIWLGTPGIAHVATLGLIDGVLATYVLATAIAAMRVFGLRDEAVTDDQRSRAEGQARLTGRAELVAQPGLAPCGLGVVGLLSGATAALKYPGLIYATLPCLAILVVHVAWLIRQQQSKRALRCVLWLLAGLSSTCLPWYAKNWWLSGNPVYPLAANLFGGQTLTPEKIAQWQAAHRVPTAAAADADAVSQLVGQSRLLMQDIARVTLTSSFVQPAMILGVVSAIIYLWQQRNRTSVAIQWCLLGGSLWILGIWWLGTHRIDRFWLPITGLWAALAAWGLTQVRHQANALAHMMLVWGLLYAVLICSSSVVTDNRYFVSLAALRDDIGDAEHLPRVPPVQAWINQNLSGAETRVLLVGEARVFEYRVDVVYSTCFDINPGEAWLAGSNAAEQRAALKAAGITHVLINWVEIQRYRSPGNYGFSQWPQPSHLEQLVRDEVLKPIDWGEGSDSVQLYQVNVGPSLSSR